MMRTSGVFVAVSLCACGSVNKAKPDAADVVHDAPGPDAFDCTKFPLTSTFTGAPATNPSAQVAFKATDPGVNYTWTFTNGTPATSTDRSPTVTWSAVGQYSVSLSETDPTTPCTASTMRDETVCVFGAPVSGPTPMTSTGGWNNYGIAFTPNKNATLTAFTITGKGNADVIQLTDANGMVLQTFALPAGSPTTYQANVAWPLMANQSYHLLSTSMDNLSWIAGMFPYNGSTISITSGWGQGAIQGGYYFGFTNLVTCP